MNHELAGFVEVLVPGSVHVASDAEAGRVLDGDDHKLYAPQGRQPRAV